MKKTVKSYTIITLGTLLLAVGVHFFEFPNRFSMGGVSGISLVAGAAFGFSSPARLATFLNLLLLLVGFLALGRGFGTKTVYSVAVFSLLLNLFERYFPLSSPLTRETMLELFFDMLFISVGAALLFREDASSGGTDILAMIVKKYTGLAMGRCLLLVDFLVVLGAFWVFGIEIGLLSLFGIGLRAYVVDLVTEQFRAVRLFLVVTEKGEAVLSFLAASIGEGRILFVTHAIGFRESRSLILVALPRRGASLFRRSLHTVDEGAIALVTRCGDILSQKSLLESYIKEDV